MSSQESDSAMNHLEHASPKELEVYLRASKDMYDQMIRDLQKLEFKAIDDWLQNNNPSDTPPTSQKRSL